MSDTWQYRVRVSGSDKEKWFERATEHRWGHRKPYLYDWPMEWILAGGKLLPAKGTWYNVDVTRAAEYDEFIGNFGGTPRRLFEKEPHEYVVGPTLFGDLDINVEVVGLSWSCDVPGGIYSYRDTYERGVLITSETSSGERKGADVAKQYAPELIEKFPEKDSF